MDGLKCYTYTCDTVQSFHYSFRHASHNFTSFLLNQNPSYKYIRFKKKMKNTWWLMPTHPLKLNSNQTRHTQLRTRSSSSCFFPVLATPWLFSQSFKTATVSRSASPQMLAGKSLKWRNQIQQASPFSTASFKSNRFQRFLAYFGKMSYSFTKLQVPWFNHGISCEENVHSLNYSNYKGLSSHSFQVVKKKNLRGHVFTQKTSVPGDSPDAKVPECTKALIPSTPSGIGKACRSDNVVRGPRRLVLWKSKTFWINAIWN